MNEARFGGVQVRVNDDGTLYIYQPDSNRVLSPELAEDLVTWLTATAARPNTAIHTRGPQEGQAIIQDTVPQGVIATTELVAQLQQDGSDHGPVPEPVVPAPKRRGRPPRKAQA